MLLDYGLVTDSQVKEVISLLHDKTSNLSWIEKLIASKHEQYASEYSDLKFSYFQYGEQDMLSVN